MKQSSESKTTAAPVAGDFSGFRVQDYVFRVKDVDPGDFITYEPSLCTGCGECAMVCTMGLWTIPKSKDKARLSAKYKSLCLECAACHAVCEADAISFRYPDGGAGIIIKHG